LDENSVIVSENFRLAEVTSMSDADRKTLKSLVWMCEQYLESKDGLDHMCMSAGEGALEVLYEHGLVSSTDRGATWTDAGKALLREN
jgi:hypothetical protein